MSPTGRGPRPERAAGPLAGSLVALGLWALVAHNSGSGWMQALGCLLAGFVAVGLLGPALAVTRVRVRAESNPAEATEGQPASVLVRTSAPVRVRVAHDGGATAGSGVLAIEVVAQRRGPVEHLDLELSSAAPFGLVWWRRRVRIPLARPLWVAPAPGAFDPSFVVGGAPGAALDSPRPRDGRVGEPRGVRPYVPGDPRPLVHWPATAHRGELMVRETERPEAALPRVRVALPDDGPAGDEAARRALGTLLALLASGSAVVVSTIERDGARTGPVYDPSDARRRMARAVARPSP